MTATARKTALPLMLTAVVALAALAAAIWLVFFAAPPRTVGDEPTLSVPEERAPAPMPKPRSAGNAPETSGVEQP